MLRIDAAGLDQLLHPTIDPAAERHLVVTGLPASPGAASGEIVFDADEAEALKGHGRDVILVRTETSPEDIHGMHAAAGILTTRGGMTSHAAVVAARHGAAVRVRRRRAAHRRQGRHHDGRAARSSARATSSPSTAPRARCSRAA